MTWTSIDQIFRQFASMGATRGYLKMLAHNDNNKQQIYFGPGFDGIKILPFKNPQAHEASKPKDSTLQASVDFWWLDDEGNLDDAPGTKLILYPNYPEVRLSGFIKNCRTARREALRPLTPTQRVERQNTPRALLLGVTEDDRVFGYVTGWGDGLAHEAKRLVDSGSLSAVTSVFHEWSISATPKSQRDQMLEKLACVHRAGWVESFRLTSDGSRKAYNHPNGAGYTLEGMLGIRPNGTPEPDLMGWEIKAHIKNGKITLMTPEPTLGAYAADYVRFIQSYGRPGRKNPDRLEFTGIHRCNIPAGTGLTMKLEGFDAESKTIRDLSGGVHLYDSTGNLAAGWSFADLTELWGRKHANTAFVSYDKWDPPRCARHYCYGPNVTLAKGANFTRYLLALDEGVVVYDPACRLKPAPEKRSGWDWKKRNQIRTTLNKISWIYDDIEDVDLSKI